MLRERPGPAKTAESGAQSSSTRFANCVSRFAFRVSRFTFHVSRFAFRVSRFGNRVSGFGLGVPVLRRHFSGIGSRVLGFRYRVCWKRVSSFEFRLSGQDRPLRLRYLPKRWCLRCYSRSVPLPLSRTHTHTLSDRQVAHNPAPPVSPTAQERGREGERERERERQRQLVKTSDECTISWQVAERGPSTHRNRSADTRGSPLEETPVQSRQILILNTRDFPAKDETYSTTRQMRDGGKHRCVVIFVHSGNPRVF